jgi:L-histidine N-alpha-methyltransferase
MAPSEVLSSPNLMTFAAQVREGLSKPGQKELPSIYLYDQIGSALFEVITLLP